MMAHVNPDPHAEGFTAQPTTRQLSPMNSQTLFTQFNLSNSLV